MGVTSIPEDTLYDFERSTIEAQLPSEEPHKIVIHDSKPHFIYFDENVNQWIVDDTGMRL